jgi:arylsulfatase A-like enzyme
MLTYNGPYSLSNAMKEPVPRPYSDPYRENPMKSFPRPAKAHPWQRNQHELIGNIDAMRNLSGQVTAVDAGVGRILEALKERGLDADTLVIYTADQGAVAGHAGFWGMGDHTRPLHGRDGTMHVPLIFRWPGVIEAGAESDHIVTNYDFMPTLLSYLGHEMPQKQSESPGRDYAPMLRGETIDDWDDVVFYEFENVRLVRTSRWKYVERKGGEPARALYDLRTDPDELDNLAGKAAQWEVEGALRARLHTWFVEYVDPRWDLWNGGSSKSALITWKELGLPAAVREGKGAAGTKAK